MHANTSVSTVARIASMGGGNGTCLTMSSLQIADVVKSRHDDVKRSIRRLAEKGVIQLPPLAEVRNHLNQKVEVYNVIERDSYIVVAQLSPEFTAALVDEWQCLKSGNSIPDFTNPVMAARAWAEQYEARQIAERTKAEIGSRREATAMNTAAQAVKKANKLELVLDRSQEFATIKRMSMLYHGQEFSWKELKHVSHEMGVLPIEVFDANYGTVKAYHADVWREVYALEIPHTSILNGGSAL
ncbi:Rha family transcriptional regulator [Bacillus subtilis]|uniref:Rha family transcriptional regulator n=1 Tax=Pseudochrobactrum asaccharolyticum TaxID=354351 RepID=UPI001F3D6338|nr:Rha family transcriptional regulator [Pseudochrobactrum asaccharolyticum]MCF7647314.1 Rha family transcriptional regulator [Pseudochrobactrum asaccharolyticum]MCF7673605.1 Rha family transcriptional regulator [Bacillus subtilis]